ncbi:MAG: hypothetical protein OEZ43_16560 [Gammaproteobacteria bacterium]|nr:hypothetical protein [Gammaproteobacteria bacterium]
MPVYASTILTSVDYSSDENSIYIKANFGDIVNYEKHFPRSRGKIIQIQISMPGKVFTETQLKRRETIEPDENAPSVIRDIIYEGNVRGGPYLVLRFSSVVTFKLDESKGSKVLTVTIDRKELEALQTPAVTQQPSTDVSEEESRATSLMDQGRRALTMGQNSEAILFFSDILGMPESRFTQDAREYLGLARERNGQLDLAKKEYEAYLKSYEKSPKANTVRQRLMTLEARIVQMERRLKDGKRTGTTSVAAARPADLFGRVAIQSYNAGLRKEGESTPDYAQGRILAFTDLNQRWRDKDKDARLSFSGTMDYDLIRSRSSSTTLQDTEKPRYEARIRSLFGEYKGRTNNIHGSFGRQSVNSGGVLGRFDGAMLGYQLKNKLSVYGVVGLPVDYEDNLTPQTNKPMFGGRLDVNEIAKYWKASVYGIQQQVDGILERRAVGGDLRYFFENKVFYSLVDYDASYGVWNFLTGHYGWQVNKRLKLDVHADRRRSPVMLTSNALRRLSVLTSASDKNKAMGELDISDEAVFNRLTNESTIKDLLDAKVSEATIRQLALDQTGESSLYTVGMNYELRKDISLIANLTISSYEAGKAQDIDATEEMPEEPDPKAIIESPFLKGDVDMIGSVQLVRRNMYRERDVVLAGLSFSINERNKRYTGNVALRTPYKEKWWLDLRGRAIYSDNIEHGTQALKVSPTARTEYRYDRRLTFELEVGADYTRSTGANEDLFWFFGNAGFRYMF